MKIEITPHREGAQIPKYGSEEAAGADLHAYMVESCVLKPGERMIIPTGICVSLPKGYEGQVRPRSGIAAKHGVTVLNAPGTIDSDYTGEIGVILINHGPSPFKISHGDRIAQFVVKKVEQPSFVWAINEMRETQRGEGSFGSTGVSK